ncbi:DinB family protein [Agrococcus sp. Marseille-P2731]|uniref:DinB family protein n=1 Tax=Agrococcus sp. Marseille-P2731 TaxID=1841862 RepID=UPI000931AC26|nr:DinB family protein [Agrococcus sp. Marseille-P2731]
MSDDAEEILQRSLTVQRDALRWKLEGLSERELRMPMTPTGTNLLGLVKHVATVASDYFGVCVGPPFPESLAWNDDAAEDNADMWAAADESQASVLGLWDRAWAHADASIAALPLDAPAHVPWWGDRGDTTLQRLLVHMIAEVARHAGHADIVRESLDGAAGLRDGVSNLPERDAQWWSAYVARLQAVADSAPAERPSAEA